MIERLKKIRKTLGLNQKEIGDRLGVSRDVISNMELGRVEMKEHFIKLICKEFNVNENWLRSGEGEMFIVDEAGDIFFALGKNYPDLNDLEKKIMVNFLNMTIEQRRSLIDNFQRLFEGNK